MALFRAALARDPHHVPAQAALVALAVEAGDGAEARALLAAARCIDPGEPELALALARLGLAEGLSEAAVAAAARVARTGCRLAADRCAAFAQGLAAALRHAWEAAAR